MSDLKKAAQQALEAWQDQQGMKLLCEAMDALGAALAEPNECHWHQDGDEDSDKWAASCGRHRYFQLNDGTPTDNHMTHCCYCGKPLVEVPIEPEDEHD
jgi:hypothetical protein